VEVAGGPQGEAQRAGAPRLPHALEVALADEGLDVITDGVGGRDAQRRPHLTIARGHPALIDGHRHEVEDLPLPRREIVHESPPAHLSTGQTYSSAGPTPRQARSPGAPGHPPTRYPTRARHTSSPSARELDSTRARICTSSTRTSKVPPA